MNSTDNESASELDFLNLFSDLKKLCTDQNVSYTSTRGQKTIPKLSYSTQGKWTYVMNYQALCKHISRSLKFLGKFFASKLGVPYQISETEFKLRGSNKLVDYKYIENLLYNEEVLCYNCKSPDTIREDTTNKIKCTSCQKERISI